VIKETLPCSRMFAISNALWSLQTQLLTGFAIPQASATSSRDIESLHWPLQQLLKKTIEVSGDTR